MEREISHFTQDAFKEEDIVKNPQLGEKVVRGPDWIFDDQDKDSKYGIIVGGEPAPGWVRVQWISKEGNLLFRESYPIGGVIYYRGEKKEIYSLAYYRE